MGLLLINSSSAVPSPAKDTATLAAHLNAVRGNKWLPNDEYRAIQREYLAWIDSRLKAGGNAQSMNRELGTAGLFRRGPDSADSADAVSEMYASHAGYLEPISVKPLRAGDNIFAIAAGIHKGIGCSLDVTAVVYQRRPVRRLVYLNADTAESKYAYHLSGLAVGEEGSTGERIVASGWVVSNCTSTWNGKRIRIDRLKGSLVEDVLARDLNAQDSDEGENVAAQVERDIVTFRYKGAVGDTDLLSGPAITRYRIVRDRAVLTSPVAVTRAGFIHEWLRMSDAEATLWSRSEAVVMRKAATYSILARGFQWDRIARCGGSPPVWEIALHPYESKTLQVFRIGGSRATELRMLAVSNKVTESCVPDDISQGLSGVGAELPW